MTTPRPRKSKLTLTEQYHIAHQKAELLAFQIYVKTGDYTAAKSHLESAFADSEALVGEK